MRLSWWVKGHGLDAAYDYGQFSNNFCLIKVKKKGLNQGRVIWSPPPSGCFKFNVDGASKGNPGLSGVGGILRDHNKDIRGPFLY